MHADRFDCNKCTWGRHCDDRNPAPFEKFEIDGLIQIKSKTCFKPMVTPQSEFLLEMYGFYKDRLLPYSGGLLQQPNYYRQAMRIIAAAEFEARKNG